MLQNSSVGCPARLKKPGQPCNIAPVEQLKIRARARRRSTSHWRLVTPIQSDNSRAGCGRTLKLVYTHSRDKTS